MPFNVGGYIYESGMATNQVIDKVVSNGLRLHVDAGNTTSYIGSGTSLVDLSGYQINGTLTNGPTFNSSNSGSLVFDGSDDYVGFGSTLDFADSSFINGFSVDTWVYPTATPSGVAAIFSSAYGTSGTQWQIYVWYSSANKFGTTQRYGGNQNDFSTSQSFGLNSWYHFVVTSNHSVCTIYVNGIFAASNSTGRPDNQPADREVRIGGFKGYAGANFNGRIANTKIYNKQLTSGEIRQNYFIEKGRFGL